MKVLFNNIISACQKAFQYPISSANNQHQPVSPMTRYSDQFKDFIDQLKRVRVETDNRTAAMGDLNLTPEQREEAVNTAQDNAVNALNRSEEIADSLRETLQNTPTVLQRATSSELGSAVAALLDALSKYG